MTFLPVVERELRVASRKPRAHQIRFFAAGVSFIVLAWIWMVSGARTPSEILAKQIFGVISVLAMAYAVLAGLILTADAISEEKRQGTLGLLFLTDLKGHDVVLGKLFATSLNAFYGLTAIFPVLAIPLLLGGLTGGDFGRMAVVLLVTLFFSLSIGMVSSSLSQNDRSAQGAALFLLMLFSVLIPALGHWISRPTVYEAWSYFSPFYAFQTSFDQVYTTKGEHFWNSVLTILGLGVFALLLSSFVVPRTWQDKGEIRWEPLRARLRRWQRGTPEKKQRYREELLQVNPFFWLASRDRCKPGYVWVWLLVVAVVWIGFYLKNRQIMRDPMMFFFTMLFLHLTFKVWIASEAGKQINEEKRTGSLELLLATPMNPKEIVEGQFFALFRQFGWPAAVVLALDLIMMFHGARTQGTEWVLLCVVTMVIFGADLFVISLVSFWLGLISRRSTRATAKALFFILMVPWLLFFAFLTFVTMVGGGRGSNFAYELIGAWFIIAALVNVFCFAWASGNLTNKFRETAVRQSDSSST